MSPKDAFFLKEGSSASGFIKSDSRKANSANSETPGPSSEDLHSRAKTVALCSETGARELLSLQNAERLLALPIQLKRDGTLSKLQIAVREDINQEQLADLRFACSAELLPVKLQVSVLKLAIELAYRGDGSLLKQSSESLQKYASETFRISIPDESPSSSVVCQFIDRLLDYALAHQASDIHIYPERDGSYVKIRIDGELRSRREPLCNLQVHCEIVRRIKVMARLDPNKSGIALDGSFRFDQSSIRVSTLPTLHGEKIVLRLASTRSLLSLRSLGYPAELQKLLCDLNAEQTGMVIFCGSTGSGKTSSLYALSQHLIRPHMSAQSLEDPVEFDLPDIIQTQVSPETGLDFDICLRAVLRQDPDFLLLGEMRDQKTAQIAYEAALTGHLILSSFHAGSIFDALERLKHLGISETMILRATRLIVHQSLEPKLCGNCKVLDIKKSVECSGDVFKAVGCQHCDYSGYLGRQVKASWLDLRKLQSTNICAENIRFLREERLLESHQLKNE